MGKRAAVIIGVNRTGDLTPLRSAASSARVVAKWLEELEKYDVTCLSDEQDDGSVQPVTSLAVQNAIEKYVTVPVQYEMLVFYFIGHGFGKRGNNILLLSGAPRKTTEAINFDGALFLAQNSGIPNIVIIADACRTIPTTRVDFAIEGIDAFPNIAEFTDVSMVDTFQATLDTKPAFEVEIGNKPRTVLTYSLMSAFFEPNEEIIRSLTVAGGDKKVVTNRKLGKDVQKRVNRILRGIDTSLSQKIQPIVPSDDDVHIASVPLPAEKYKYLYQTDIQKVGFGAPSMGKDDDAKDDYKVVKKKITLGSRAIRYAHKSSHIDLPEIALFSSESSWFTDNLYQEEISNYLPDTDVTSFELITGFVIQGANVKDVHLVSNRDEENFRIISTDCRNLTSVVRFETWGAGSALIEFEDGRSIPFAIIENHIGHAYVSDEGLKNISYVPSKYSDNWRGYMANKNSLNTLRAKVAFLVNKNSFQLGTKYLESSFAREIRVEQALDPSLGLYASYAYAESSNEKQIKSVMNYMRRDINADIFDVNMLAYRFRKESKAMQLRIVPFCPMLTQGWNLLRVRQITLPEVLKKARPYLEDSVWTTFSKESTESIIKAINDGEIT